MYLGIDLGTSACRAIVINQNNDIKAQAKTTLPMPINDEQDAFIWWEAVLDVFYQLRQQIDLAQIQALAVDGTSATVLLTDETGKPLHNALMYNDSRSQAEAMSLEQYAPATSPVQTATSSLAKLLYLQQCLPHAHHILHQADWIMNRLCGQYGISDENNCLKLGFDPIQRQWPAWLYQLPIAQNWLPKVLPAGTFVGTITPQLAQQFGFHPQLKIVTGTTDSTASFIATGAKKVGEGVTVLGSTLVLKILSEQPIFAPEYGIYSHRLGDKWLVGGASNTGGHVLLHYFSLEQLAAMTPLLHPTKLTGLDYYPLVGKGERFPINNPNFSPQIINPPIKSVTFFQALLEGIARIEKQGYKKLMALGAPSLNSVRTVGGGASNAAWTTIRQRMLNVPFLPPLHTEAAYGSAILARQGCEE